jgi:hypothetical protein
VIDSGATNHKTGSKDLVTEVRQCNTTVSYIDKTRSKVTGLGKVVVTPDVSLVYVLLIETLGYNILLVHQLSRMGLRTFFDIDGVLLFWSKSLKVAFIRYIKFRVVCGEIFWENHIIRGLSIYKER